jgi:hypothetical protein
VSDAPIGLRHPDDAAITWWVNRGKERREKNKDQREEKGEERSEESQDLATQRGIANDALARERFAYERLAIAEREALSCREEKRALEVEYEIARKKADHADDLQAEVASLKRTNRALDNDLQRLLDRRRAGLDEEGGP